MTTYRLPEALGGGEVEKVTPAWKGNALISEVALVSNPNIRLTVSCELLTEVQPSQPEPGYYLAVDDSNGATVLAERDGEDWHLTGQIGSVPWAAVRDNYSTFTRLIPAPAPEPVTLPWSYDALNVSLSDAGPWPIRVALGEDGWVYLPAADARTGGYALLTAADEADRRVSDV